LRIGRTHFVKLVGKENIEVLNVDFPDGPLGKRYGCILANKFLHHLQRTERQQFLRWGGNGDLFIRIAQKLLYQIRMWQRNFLSSKGSLFSVHRHQSGNQG